MLEGRRQGGAAGPRAADREERDQPVVHRERQDGPRRGAETAGERRVALGLARRERRAAAPRRRRRASAWGRAPWRHRAGPAAPARTKPSPSGRRTAATSAPRRAAASAATAARGSGRIEAREERRTESPAPRVLSDRGPEGARRGGRPPRPACRSCRARTGPVAAGRPGARRPAARCGSGTGIASAAPRPWWSSRASGPPRPGPACTTSSEWMARPTMPSSARGLEREAKAALSDDGQSCSRRSAGGSPRSRRERA